MNEASIGATCWQMLGAAGLVLVLVGAIVCLWSAPFLVDDDPRKKEDQL